jgi:protein arginine N-methyltransferase 1
MARGSMMERLPTARDLAGVVLARSTTAQRLAYAWGNRKLFSDFFQHDRMLADQVRVGAYKAAVEKHLEPGQVVVDVGTGTGVLGFLAAQRVARVHAVEHGPIIEAAEAVARDNGLDNVTFHRAHSSKLELPEKADAIIHEQIGEAAYDERVVENLADLRDRLLKPGGRIYPGRLDMYVEPVQLREDLRAPFVWQQTINGIDFRRLRAFATPTHQYLFKAFRPFPFGHFLCEPEAVTSIDLETASPGDMPTAISYERPVAKAGELDGYCVYFTAYFDDELSFTSSPESLGTSWGNILMRVESQPVEVGDTIRLSMTAGPLSRTSSWKWDWDRTSTVRRG